MLHAQQVQLANYGSCWINYRWVNYCGYAAAAAVLAAVFFAGPMYLHLKQLPGVVCPGTQVLAG